MKKGIWILIAFISTTTFAQKAEDLKKFGKYITQEGLKEKLSVIASAEMEGRETATPGQKKAAAYIESQFKKWGLHLPLDKSNRIVDFIINKNGKLIWVETNFYSAGGSKLKSTAGEYKDLFKFCKENNIDFVWITDGNGWISTKKPLRETFNLTDYIINLNMIKNGVLKEIIQDI
jgi:hypothetical protein